MKPPEEQKQDVKARFNAMSGTYDQINFLRRISLRLVELADLKPGQQVLDLATGTGTVLIAAALKVGYTGQAIGIDLSPEMLARAREKISNSGLTHASVREGDAEHLDFPEHTFDQVFCSLGLFFMPDMLGAVREWHRVLKPGGSVGFSSFGEGLFHPLIGLWRERLARHHLETAATPIARLNNLAECCELLVEAGFPTVNVTAENVGYYLDSPDERINDILSGLEGEPLKQLPLDLRDQIIQEHRAELETLMTPQGLYISVPAIYSFACR